jgi:hypothetical protein
MSIEDQIQAAASALVFKWVFPTEATESPDDLTTTRAYILKQLLVRRMTAMVGEGKDPFGLSIAELLPDVKPDEIVVDPELV